MTEEAGTIREELRDIREEMRGLQEQVRSMAEAIARLVGEHSQRIGALERAADENRVGHRAMEERLHKLDLRCAAQHGGDRPPLEEPVQDWWDRSVGRITGGLLLGGAGVAVGVLVERLMR